MEIKKDMKDYGLTDQFCALASQFPGMTIARVISQERGMYRIVSAYGEKYAEVSGKFFHETEVISEFPAVGDFVMTDMNQGGNAIIHQVLHRKSVFIRKAAGTGNKEQVVAANIDMVFLCMSLNRDFNIRRLERYLSMAWDSGATPVIVLTKADLCEDIDAYVAEVERIAFGVDILVTSSIKKDGCKTVQAYMEPGKTIALLGSSGVGKSTLINGLIGEELLETGGLRKDDKGHHTTTHRELIRLDSGGLVIDTPGMRELGMWDSEEGLEKAFAEVEELSKACRFRNCTHTNEPGCAILKAMETGDLSEERWQAYLKLKAESAYAKDSQSYLLTKKQKFKEIAKYNRSNPKR